MTRAEMAKAVDKALDAVHPLADKLLGPGLRELWALPEMQALPWAKRISVVVECMPYPDRDIEEDE
jgi:hypothetical protein